MKVLTTLMIVSIALFETSAIACSGCSKSKSGNMASNIQSTMASSSNGLSGARIIGGTGQSKAFKNDKVFESVGKDQSEVDPNWKSSISQ